MAHLPAHLRPPGPARHNLSASPVGSQRLGFPTIANASAAAGGAAAGSEANSARSGGETDRAYAAFKAAQQSPKSSPNKHASLNLSPEEQLLDADSSPSSITPPLSLQSASSPPSQPVSLSRKPSQADANNNHHHHHNAAASIQPSPSAQSLSSRKKAKEFHLSLTAAQNNEAKEQLQQSQQQQQPNRSFQKRLEMEEELVEQKLLIQKKDEYIAGLQRNCETLSALCAKHMQQVTLLKADFDRVNLEKHLLENDTARSAANEALAAKLMKENDELLSLRKSLTTKVETTQTKLYQFQQQLSELNDQKEDLTSDLNKERNNAHALRVELEEMKHILNSNETSASSTISSGLHESENKLLHLKKEHEMNKQTLETLTASFKSLQNAHQKLQNVHEKLSQSHTVALSDVARYKKQAVETKREHTALTELSEALKETHQNLADEHNKLRKEYEALLKRLPELEEKYQKSEESRKKLKKEHEVVWSQKQDLILQVDEIKAEMALIKKQLDVYKQSDVSLSARSGGGGEDQDRASSLEAQLEELQTRYQQLDDLLRENETSAKKWQEKYQASKSEKEALQAEIDELKSDLSAAQADNDSKVRSMANDTSKEDLENETAKNKQLSTQLSTLQSKFDALQTANQQQVVDLKSSAAKLKEADEAREKLEKELRDTEEKHKASLVDLKKKSEEYFSNRLSETEKQLSALQKQLLESQHKNAELNALLDQPRPQALSANDIAKLKAREKELQATIAKLIVNEEASEASFTCFSCVGIFKKPVTCIPCGHSYCLSCIEKTQVCTQCRPPVKVSYYANELLEELASRYVFRKQALATLKEMAAVQFVK